MAVAVLLPAESHQATGQLSPDLLSKPVDEGQPADLIRHQLETERAQRMRGAESVLARPTIAATGAALHYMGKAYLDSLVEQWEAGQSRPTRWGHLLAAIPSARCVKAMGADAFLTVLSQHLDGMKRNTLAASLGNRAEFEIFMYRPEFVDSWHRTELTALCGTDINMRDMMRRLDGSILGRSHKPLKHSQRVAYGTWLIESLATITGLVEVRHMPSPMYPGQVDKGVFHTRKFFDFVKRWKEVSSRFRTSHMPMVVAPRSFTKHDDGGYLSILSPAMAVPWAQFPIATARNTTLLAAINKLQAQPWAIDMAQLELVTEVWDRGGDVGSMPPASVMEPVTKPNSDQSWHDYWIYLADLRKNALRSRTVTALAVAREHEHRDQLFSVHFADYRGRMYARGPVTPHGPGHIRSLVEFAEPVVVDKKRDRAAFAWHIGSAMGLEKDAAVRERLFRYHEPMVLAVGQDPHANKSAWCDVDDPFEFVRLCRAWYDLQDKGTGLTGLPVRRDQSCSGYAHLACLTRDHDLAAQVNVVGDSYRDIYESISWQATQILHQIINEEGTSHYVEPAQSLACYVYQNWPGRSAIKAAVMPLIYGRTQFSMQRQLSEHYRNQVLNVVTNGGYRPMAMAVLAAKVLVAASWQLIPRLRDLAKWLKVVGGAQIDAGMRPHWWTPDGLMVESYSSETHEERVIVHAAGRAVEVRAMSDEGGGLRRGRSLGSLTPDYLHSLDAAFARMVTLRWDGPLFVVHDCFATTIDRDQELHQLLLKSWREFYQADPLLQLWIEAQKELGQPLPPPPGMECEDIPDIGSNPYLFC